MNGQYIIALTLNLLANPEVTRGSSYALLLRWQSDNLWLLSFLTSVKIVCKESIEIIVTAGPVPLLAG